jgi:hypothetical protein
MKKKHFSFEGVKCRFLKSIKNNVFLLIANEPRAMARLNEAIAEYHQKTCIRFKKRTSEAAYVSVFKGSG